MKQEANCPRCGHTISIWQVMKAPTPFNLRCPDCGVRIHVEGWNTTLTVQIIISGLLLSVLLLFLFVTTKMPVALLSGIVVMIVLLSEILLSLFVVNRGNFIIPKRRVSDRSGVPRVDERVEEQ